MDRDELTTINLDQAGRNAFGVVDKVQSLRKRGERVMAIANALNCAARGLGLDARDLLSISDNYLLDGDKKLRPEFGGAMAYFKGEGDSKR